MMAKVSQAHFALRPFKRPLARQTSLFVRGFLFTIICGMAMVAHAIEPERPGQQSFLTRAVFADGRLWVLSDAGALSSITEGQDARVVETLPEKVLDLCLRDGHPTVITVAGDDSAWTLRRHSGETWSVVALIQTNGDGLLAMDCGESSVALLTTRRLIEVDHSRQDAVWLSGELGRGLVSSTFGTSDQFFVGFNAGEWGGGLRRINRQSGNVTVIERNSSGALCGGPLNTGCDPVNGIAAEPWKPDCVVAAVGLVHFRPSGRLVEVCGNQVQQLYYKSYDEGRSIRRIKEGERFNTVAFFGLQRDGDSLWAVGIDGLYDIGPGGAERIVPLPHFKDVGGISVSFELPKFVLVLTRVNQRRSISGPVPLLVLR